MLIGTLGGAGALARPAGARASAGPRKEVLIAVIEVSGLLDPIQVDFMATAVRDAEANDAEALVIRLDSSGSVANPADLSRLVRSIRGSKVPVAVWIGPGKEARAGGEAADVFNAAAVRGVAPRVSGIPAREGEDAPLPAATLGDFIVGLDGEGAIEIPTTIVRREGRPPQRQLAPEVRVQFDEPGFISQLLHAVATPSAAYLLLVLGLLLVVFEFFTAGIGIAAVVGGASLVASAYGLGVLPTRPVALAVIVLGILGYAVDVQAGAPRAWTVIGSLSVVAGSFFLFADGLSVPLAVLALVIAGVGLFMVSAMPAVVRTRFSTPTIGRESMLGEEGTALSDVDPDGVVTVRSAPWRARTNRATPIRAGDPIRVASIDGLLLEVEPLEGAARDAGH